MGSLSRPRGRGPQIAQDSIQMTSPISGVHVGYRSGGERRVRIAARFGRCPRSPPEICACTPRLRLPHDVLSAVATAPSMTELARKLRVTDYFSLGWGAMIGVGWLVVMDDWLVRGGPLGAILGFAIGGALLLPIGYVYGQLVMSMPDAAGEIAYTSKVFSEKISFITGWMMVLAYFIVCPWE